MERIEQQVQDTLESIDDVVRPQSNPFLYTRTLQRLRKRQTEGLAGRLMPVVAIALMFFICLNVVSYFKVGAESEPMSTQQPGLNGFATEYSLLEEQGL